MAKGNRTAELSKRGATGVKPSANTAPANTAAPVIPLRPKLSLVPGGSAAHSVDEGTVQALTAILAAAMNGQVTGLAYAVKLRDKGVVVNATGECHRDPLRALGMVDILADEIRNMILG